ncbi:hypothetical protein, partial [Methylocapsa sp. S129]|uniref:hypothetical protein n=1 Tax=Methylocapsa sp. S129 TaxID=1641869 RepID=UPI00131E6CB6
MNRSIGVVASRMFAAFLAISGMAEAGFAAQVAPSNTSNSVSASPPPLVSPQPAAGAGSAAPPVAPAPAEPAQTAAEVAGFRSALFGMVEADVRAAITKDFAVGADGVRVSQNGAEHTQVLSIKASDALPEGGGAEVSYVLGYKTKKLIQVSVSWSKATDDKLTPERLVSNADTLHAYFMAAGYKPDTIVNNVAV